MGTGRMGHPQVCSRERRGSGNVQFVSGVEGTLERSDWRASDQTNSASSSRYGPLKPFLQSTGAQKGAAYTKQADTSSVFLWNLLLSLRFKYIFYKHLF